MSELPVRPDLDQLRRQARELLRAAGAGDAEALRRIHAVSQKRTLSAAQLAIAREHGFPSWPRLRAEVLRRRASGETPSGTSGSLEVLAADLVAKQYADRPHLRPVFDAVIEVLPALGGPVTVQARGTLVSLVSPRRTFAVLKPTTKSRMDLGLRLDSGQQPQGRLERARDLGQATVRIPLTTPAEVDDEVRDWLKKAYDENTVPPADEPKRPPSRPRPVLGPMTVVIEGTGLPGLSCNPEPDGTVHRNIHVAFTTSPKGIPEGTRTLTVPGRPGVGAGPFPGDAGATRWETEVTVRGSAGDGYDFTGPGVRGDRTDRHLGLVWGDVPGDGTLQLFRGAKLRLADVPPAVITEAMRPGHRLVARVRLTDDRGNPICARVPSSHLTWSAETALSRTDIAASPALPATPSGIATALVLPPDALVLPPRRRSRRIGQPGKPARIRRKDAVCSAASTGSTRRTSGASPGRRNSWTW